MKGTEREFVVSGSDVQFTTEVSSYRYKYDANNNLTQLLNTVDGNEWTTTYTYDGDNRPDTVTLNSGVVIDDTYDSLGRITQRSIGTSTPMVTPYSYLSGADGSQTALVSQINTGPLGTYSYTYDENGNIETVTRNNYTTTYHYDSANQLIRVDSQSGNTTTTYTYDGAGNITKEVTYSYTSPDTAVSDANKTYYLDYIYSTGEWKDQLVQVNEYTCSDGMCRQVFGRPVTYDASGNPTSYKNFSLTWEGRQLTSYGTISSYEYDENGLRTSKTVYGATTDYFYNGSLLMGLTRGSNTLLFSYDANGGVVSVNFNGTEYYYVKNAQSDIIGIVDEYGTVMVTYSYGVWGSTSASGTMSSTLGAYNPFRYRGYVYDTETGFYYLQSRYYDPYYGRFISPDAMLSTGQGILGNNVFTYCLNNPGSYVDSLGSKAEKADQYNEDEYKTVGAGIQLDLSATYGLISGGFGIEIIVYWDTPECAQTGEIVVAVYCYAEGSATIDTEILPDVSGIVQALLENADSIKLDGANALQAIMATISLDASISFCLCFRCASD